MESIKAVGGYIRVSSQEQSQKGLSLESQQADIEEYCRKNGYQLVKLYIDRGITARKNLYKRVAFMNMMNDVQERRINHIVVLRLDRFFRNVYDYHRMMHEFLEPADCGWSAVKEDYNTTTTNGRLMINLRLAIAEQECDQDSDRIKDVQANRVKGGFVISGKTPLGLSIAADKRLVPNKDAPIVADIFDTFISCNSIRKTMEIINERYGQRFSYRIMSHILRDTYYQGKYRGNDSFCEPIIQPSVYAQVQALLSKNVRERPTNRSYIFSGLVVCACCGRKMAGCVHSRNHDLQYYRCNHAKCERSCPNGHIIKSEIIENYLLGNVERLLSDYTIEYEAKEKTAPAVKGNRSQIEAKISRLNELFVDGLIDMDELKRRRADLESQIVEATVPEPRDMTAVNAFLNSGFRNIYNDLSVEEKQVLWRSIIREIKVSGNDIKEVVFL